MAVLVGLVMVTSFAACDKQPVAGIETAKTAIDAAVNDGSEVYVAEDFKKVNEAMAAAMAEVKSQDAKIFKNYDKANEMLAAVKSEALAVKEKAEAERGRLRLQSGVDLEASRAAVDSARKLLEHVRTGKGLAADIMVMKADLTGLDGELTEIQAMVMAGDYAEASERAKAVSDKAASLSNEVRVALAKKAATQAKGKSRKTKLTVG